MNQYSIQNLVDDMTQESLPRTLYESLRGNLPVQRGHVVLLSPSRIMLTISGATTVSVETEVTYTPPAQTISRYRRRKVGGGSEIVQSHRRKSSMQRQEPTIPPLDLNNIITKSVAQAVQRTVGNIPRTI